MQYPININNIKKSATLLTIFLKEKGFTIPRNVALEAVARVLLIKNYNTIEALAKRPRIIEYFQEEKKYFFEITINCNKETLLNLLNESFKKANAKVQIENLLQDKEDFSFEVDLRKDDSNILVAIMLFSQNLQTTAYQVKRFEYCRLSCEKGSLMQAITTPKPQAQKSIKI